MSDKGFWVIIAVLILGFAGLVTYSKMTAPPKVTSNGSSNVYGKADSPVTLTEYIDFQCEACYAYYPTVKQVKEKYKDQVKFQVKNFPIFSSHRFAMKAAVSAEAAAQQGKFWEMHDLIFEGQKTWQMMQDPQEQFNSYAETIGLDMTKFKTDISAPETDAAIDADLKEVQEIGGNGTPTFAINGKKIETPQNSVEAFSKLLDDELAKSGQ